MNRLGCFSWMVYKGDSLSTSKQFHKMIMAECRCGLTVSPVTPPSAVRFKRLTTVIQAWCNHQKRYEQMCSSELASFDDAIDFDGRHATGWH